MDALAQKLLMETINRIDETSSKTQSEVAELRVEVGKLQIKSGMWGFVAGAVPTSCAAVWAALKHA